MNFYLQILLLLWSLPAAQAGFRDPAENSGERSRQLEEIQPRRAPPPPVQNRRVAQDNSFGPPVPKTFQPQKDQNRDLKIPRSIDLPERVEVHIPDLNLPKRGSAPIPEMPSSPELSLRNRAQIHNFSRQARLQLLPTKSYPENPRSVEIVNTYADALKTRVHKPIRTPLDLTLAKTAKILSPPPPIHYENMVKRLDALFDGLYLSYPQGIYALWKLSQDKSNPLPLQARDALFAGILSQRSGWQTAASNLFESGAQKNLDAQKRYLEILWKALDGIENINLVDRVVARVNPIKAKLYLPQGDKANYSMAKRILAGKSNPTISSEIFSESILEDRLKEKLVLLKSISHMRLKNGNHDFALKSLQTLEEGGRAETQEEARLILARFFLKNSDYERAADHYKKVRKTRVNRLEVLAEQSFAEFKQGQTSESLGKSMGLQSPYFQYGYAPDIHLIEILNRKTLCDFGGAEAGIERFKERYSNELMGLENLLQRKPNPKDFYAELISYHSKDAPMKFERFLLRLSSVMENQKLMNYSIQELERIDKVGSRKYEKKRPPHWEEFSLDMKKLWGKRSSEMKLESARAALDEASYLRDRLKNNFAQVELLALDVATGATKNFNLHSALNFPVRRPASVEIKQDEFHWPFENEVWEDEIDYLKMKNPSKCPDIEGKRI